MMDDNKIRKAFIIAVNQIFEEHIFDQTKFTRNFPECKQLVCDDIKIKLSKFDEHTWHTLVEYAKIMPDEKIVFHFRDGREKEIDLRIS